MLRPSVPDNADTAKLQQASQEALRTVGRKPWLRAKSINVTLIAGSVDVQHGLKRKPVGWMFHSLVGVQTPYVAAEPDANIISVSASLGGTCVLEIW